MHTVSVSCVPDKSLVDCFWKMALLIYLPLCYIFSTALPITDVRNTVQPFIQLIERHENNFYRFVHSVHSQDTSHLFDDLLAYIDKLFSMMSSGLPGKVDMAKLVQENLNEQQYVQLKEEINKLCNYHLQRKIRHLQRTRRKVLEGTGITSELEIGTEQSALELAAAEGNSMGVIEDMEELDFISDGSDGSDAEEDELYSSDESAAEQDNGQLLRKEQQRRHKMDDESALPPPKLTVIPSLTPAFVRAVVSIMT